MDDALVLRLLGDKQLTKEQNEAKRLFRELSTAKKAVKVAEEELARTTATLDNTAADLEAERQKFLDAREEVTRAEHNAAKHFQAKQDAETKAKEARQEAQASAEEAKHKANANAEEAAQKISDSTKAIEDLQKQLEVSRKQPEQMKTSIDELRLKLGYRGDELRKSEQRTMDLEQENAKLQDWKDDVLRSGRNLGAGTPSRKRVRDHSRDSNRRSDGSHSSYKKPRMEPDPHWSGSRRSNDGSPSGGIPMGPRRRR